MLVPLCSQCWAFGEGAFTLLKGSTAFWTCSVCGHVSLLELEPELIPMTDKPKVQKAQKLQTKIVYSEHDYRAPWAAVWRDEKTTLTAVLPTNTRAEAERALRTHPGGPPNALWLPTDDPE